MTNKLCRDCKWYQPNQNGVEDARCHAPQHDHNIERAKELAALKLINPDIRPREDENQPFCSQQRQWTSQRACGPEGRWWEERTHLKVKVVSSENI